MPGSPKFSYLLSTLAALGLSSCAVKDGRLDFTWWQDAAAPIVEDDVIIESGGGGYYHSAPAPARVPDASIPKEEEAPTPQPAQPKQVVAQQQPATQQPPATPRPTTRKPAIQQNIPGVHVVQPGDTLTALARRYGTTVNALVAANGMASANVPLLVNQRLKLPTASQAPAARPVTTKPAVPAAPARPAAKSSGTYTVKAGDTLYKISRQYGVRPAALMQANGLTPETANTIRVGQTLRIPAAQ